MPPRIDIGRACGEIPRRPPPDRRHRPRLRRSLYRPPLYRLNVWSKWLEFWLQTLKPFIPTYVKDGNQVMDEIVSLKLPPHALLFVTNANYMYNIIDTDYDIRVITWWLKDLSEEK